MRCGIGEQRVKRVKSLRFALFRQFLEQLLGKNLRGRRANLFALARKVKILNRVESSVVCRPSSDPDAGICSSPTGLRTILGNIESGRSDDSYELGTNSGLHHGNGGPGAAAAQ
jgi:hypothetical protein